jgi:hypothetical protein
LSSCSEQFQLSPDLISPWQCQPIYSPSCPGEPGEEPDGLCPEQADNKKGIDSRKERELKMEKVLFNIEFVVLIIVMG